jgi:long-chain acyl-CoA synthetase
MPELTRPSLDYPAVPLDELLHRAARRWPDRVAITPASQGGPRGGSPAGQGDGSVTFAELDAAADRAAWRIGRLAGGPGHRVAVTTALSADFAAAFFGILRSGNVAVTVNPLNRPEAAIATIARSGAVAAVLTAPLLAAVEAAADLAELASVSLASVSAASASAPAGSAEDAEPAAPTAGHPDDLACLHFTSGTTGSPKGVLLTHRNLIANAAQTATAHSLGPDAVSFIALPAYHLMHLNAAVYAGATQVLYGAPALAGRARVADSLAVATASGATHYYTLPVLLNMLAADPGLGQLEATGLRGMFCGGSALPAPTAVTLSARFGIPVLQGFGLAEASSMTHLDLPSAPRPGSAGVPASDTECRIVDVSTRAELAARQRGEVEVRGPQLMAGYADGSTGMTAGGWFATGDVGYVDDDGYLFLVDRLKDVFKCDNEMVLPSELERIVASHPGVRDCAVVDRPDPIRGAVPVALVVLSAADVALGSVAAAANARLAPFEQIADVLEVPEIPRTRIGKIDRRALRALASPEPALTGA